VIELPKRLILPIADDRRLILPDFEHQAIQPSDLITFEIALPDARNKVNPTDSTTDSE
jgi:hypothetical protein